jgi:hypothetical protein
MKTYRRDKLRRLVEAGKVETVATYHYDDMSGERRSHGAMPVAIMPAEWRDRKEGVCYLRPSEFSTKSGYCYERDGIVTLIVHQNSSYDFRIKGG